VTLFVASEQPLDGYYDLELVWGQLARAGVETVQVPGDHTTVIVEPNVRVLAARLKDCLVRGRGELNSGE
jgi:thioesterase domain-containing protein